MKKQISLVKLLAEIQADASDPQASADIVLVMDKLASDQNLRSMLQSIKMPTDKYKAITGFASLLGIPEQRLQDFIQQQRINTQNGQEKNPA